MVPSDAHWYLDRCGKNEFHTGEVVAAVKKNGKDVVTFQATYFPEIAKPGKGQVN